jgi:protein KRI1
VEEQRALRKETISAFHGAVDDEESEDDLLVPREKTKDEAEREEEEYREFLEREVGEDLHDLITLDAGDESAPYLTDEPEPETKDEKKRRKKEKKGKEKEAQARKAKSQEDNDREFLMKYIRYSVQSIR